MVVHAAIRRSASSHRCRCVPHHSLTSAGQPQPCARVTLPCAARANRRGATDEPAWPPRARCDDGEAPGHGRHVREVLDCQFEDDDGADEELAKRTPSTACDVWPWTSRRAPTTAAKNRRRPTTTKSSASGRPRRQPHNGRARDDPELCAPQAAEECTDTCHPFHHGATIGEGTFGSGANVFSDKGTRRLAAVLNDRLTSDSDRKAACPHTYVLL